MTFPSLNNCTVAVIGLGYVGLPLALAFAEKKSCFKTKIPLNRKIIGFDINKNRINQLSEGLDSTNEVKEDKLKNLSLIKFTSQVENIALADVFIITVPTPIKDGNIPDLLPLKDASTTVGKALKIRKIINKQNKIKIPNPIIIYESTVYPGCTEEICLPILEKESDLESNKGFFYGYSPERINPGDPNHKLKDIQKITSGGNQESGNWINDFYSSIIEAGTHLTKNIKIAETAKVIENTQRDLNIAFVNELSMIFKALNISTLEVLEAAKTKWNFLDFSPGLVGGHCIGIDPYYLKFKSKQMGFSPRLVSSGRQINNGMAKWIVDQLIIEMARRKLVIGGTKVLILGYSYKENCGDHRNSRVLDVISALKVYGLEYEIVDPYVDSEACKRDYAIEILNKIPDYSYSAVIAAVGHDIFRSITPENWKKLIINNGIIFDIKGICPKNLPVLKI